VAVYINPNVVVRVDPMCSLIEPAQCFSFESKSREHPQMDEPGDLAYIAVLANMRTDGKIDTGSV
jgi:hypothetical protein